MVLDGNFSENHIYHEPDINKVKYLIDSLLSNAGLKSGSPLWCERIIVRYLEDNISGLKKILQDTGLDPFMEMDQALELVHRSLYGMVSEKVLPVINRFVEESDFSFLDKISGNGTISDEFRKDKLHDFIQILFGNRQARYNMNGVYNIFCYNVIERYTSEILVRKGFLYQKFFTEQKIPASHEELIVLLKVLLLIKNTVYIKIPIEASTIDLTINIAGIGSDRLKLRKYIDGMKDYIISFLKVIPAAVIELGIKSNLPDYMTDEDEYICKFLYILNARYQNYENISKPDRGAESPDKSWFNIAEKNSAYFGYNREIIRELQNIAGEKCW